MVHTGDTGIRVEQKFQGLDLVRWFLEREREREEGEGGKEREWKGGGLRQSQLM